MKQEEQKPKQKPEGGLMSGYDLLVVFAIAVALCVYGIWKYSNAEQNDYAKVLSKLQSLTGDFNSLTSDFEKLKSASDTKLNEQNLKIQELLTKIDGQEKEIDSVQTHCGKISKSVTRIEGQVIPKEINFNLRPTGAIPVEIVVNRSAKAVVPQGKTPTKDPATNNGSGKKKQPLGRGVQSVLGN